MGREEHCKQISLACVHSDSATLGLPRSQRVCFPSLHCSDSRLLCWELSDVGPGLHALPRSKPLRFRFSGTPQRHSLGWACVLCPSQVQAAQATGCLVSVVSPGRECILSPPWSQPLSFLDGSGRTRLRCDVCLFWGVDLWLRPSQQMSTVQNPKKSWLATGSLLAVW